MGPFLPLSCILLKFYIKPQHSWRPHDRPFVVSYWNSTSNHNSFEIIMVIRRLYLIEILHQTTTHSPLLGVLRCCILLKFYIKPQPTLVPFPFFFVVSYWNSTSNHNSSLGCVWVISVVSYWNSTSNHNLLQEFVNCWRLYLIEILHQTTTISIQYVSTTSLYLIEILHQTTTTFAAIILREKLYLIEILHQTTTPMLRVFRVPVLYLIEILHQTTTSGVEVWSTFWLYLIEILHQTTTPKQQDSYGR